MSDSITKRDALRHVLATLAYRGGKPLRDVPDGFSTFRASSDSRTPMEILVHICDLLDWARGLVLGKEAWRETPPRGWDLEVERFFDALQRLDDAILGVPPESLPAERLIQGPIADAFTHVGQISFLRRLAGAPVRGENYSLADIAPGRLGRGQAPAKREFD